MNRACVSALFLLALGPAGAAAQSVPVARGAVELELGVVGMILPPDVGGSFSVQPAGRAGYFVMEALEVQAEVSYRVYPLGGVAPKSLAVSGNVLWYPTLAERNLYLLGGLGIASSELPGEDTSWDPVARGAVGYKIPLQSIRYLSAWHLTVEVRGEFLLRDETDFVTGALLAFSYFL